MEVVERKGQEEGRHQRIKIILREAVTNELKQKPKLGQNLRLDAAAVHKICQWAGHMMMINYAQNNYTIFEMFYTTE